MRADVLLLEIGLVAFVALSLFTAWRKPGSWVAGRARRSPADGGAGAAGAGDRAPLIPPVPTRSGSAAKRLGEDD